MRILVPLSSVEQGAQNKDDENQQTGQQGTASATRREKRTTGKTRPREAEAEAGGREAGPRGGPRRLEGSQRGPRRPSHSRPGLGEGIHCASARPRKGMGRAPVLLLGGGSRRREATAGEGAPRQLGAEGTSKAEPGRHPFIPSPPSAPSWRPRQNRRGLGPQELTVREEKKAIRERGGERGWQQRGPPDLGAPLAQPSAAHDGEAGAVALLLESAPRFSGWRNGAGVLVGGCGPGRVPAARPPAAAHLFPSGCSFGHPPRGEPPFSSQETPKAPRTCSQLHVEWEGPLSTISAGALWGHIPASCRRGQKPQPQEAEAGWCVFLALASPAVRGSSPRVSLSLTSRGHHLPCTVHRRQVLPEQAWRPRPWSRPRERSRLA